MTTTACTAATAETGQFDLPAAIGPVLRVTRDASDVVLNWPTVRPLLAGEHFHVKRYVGRPPAAFTPASAEGLVDPTWRESLDTSPLILYDLRIANGCEDESPDESP